MLRINYSYCRERICIEFHCLGGDINFSGRLTQEYFLRPKGSSNLNNESEKEKLSLCLIAAIERRVSHVRPMSFPTKVFVYLFDHI